MAEEGIDSITYVISSLERPDWLIAAGLDKGLHHDRTETGGLKGTVLSVGSTIRFRQTSPMSNMGVILGLLNDDQKTEEHLEVTVEWREIFCKHASVPFLSTPYTYTAGQLIAIDVEVSGSQKVLPVYKAGGNAELFFQLWDLQSAEYALFVSDYARILIPAKDKEVLRALHQTSGLPALTAYYDGVFEYFNYLTGLSFESVAPTDKNIPNRYFMKADKSGGGAAYYSGGWTAESSDSVAAFWLNTKATNFGSLHEIAHGYEGKFISDAGVRMSEIWHNILATSYQHQKMGEAFYQESWLYEGGEERLYESARAAFDKGLTDVGPAGHLILFFYLLLVKSMGESGLIEFYRRYRRISNTESFSTEDHPAMDLLSKVGIDVGNVDFSPAMLYVKVSLSLRQVVENCFSNAVPVYPLYLLVKDTALRYHQTRLGLRSPLDLVSCSQFRSVEFEAGLSIRFDKGFLADLIGKVLLLRDGQGAARVVRIASETISVSNLPIGVYALQMPSVRNGEYQCESHYVVVREGGSEVDCLYRKRYASVLADQTILLGGLNGVFCRLAVDISTGSLVISVINEAPHSHFKGVVYAHVMIKDVRGRVVFYREMLGDRTDIFSSVISVNAGFSIEVMHKEPSRVTVSNSTVSPVFNTEAQINELMITAKGLLNASLGTRAEDNLRLEIDKCAATFVCSPHLVFYNEYPLKQDVRKAIDTFDEPARSQLFERYRTLEFFHPPVGRELSSVSSLWRFQGLYDRNIGSVRMNVASQRVIVSFDAGVAHELFSSVYLAIMLRSREGEIIYHREINGDVPIDASEEYLPFPVGSILSVMHREPGRSWIEDVITGRKTLVAHVEHAQNAGVAKYTLSSYWPAATEGQ